MKKVFTILFSAIVLLSGLTVSFSAHYCQGKYICSRLSLTGELANCGMNLKKSESKDVTVSDLMCVNEVKSLTVGTDYFFTTQVHDLGTNIKYSAPLTAILHQPAFTHPAPQYRQLPPGPSVSAGTRSEVLCIFRI